MIETSFPCSPSPSAPAGEPASDRPTVTILLCNYNYAPYLPAAIDSALAQRYRPLEIIVVDDGSTDSSREILKRYVPRIRTVLKANGGQPSALNTGFRESRGEIICLLDADDVFAANDKVERIVSLFERNPDSGWVFHELDYIDKAGDVLSFAELHDRATVEVIEKRRTRYPDVARLDLRPYFVAGKTLPYTCPAFSGLSFRRKTLEAILPMPEDIARATDEFPKFAALAIAPGVHVRAPLALQRIHHANAATFRADARIATAMRYAKTAYHLRRRYAHTQRLMDKLFARAFGELLGAFGLRSALATADTGRYLSEFFDPIVLARQAPRIAFHAIRSWRAERHKARIDR